MKTSVIVSAVALLAGLIVYQCEKEEENESVELTQEKLDNAVTHLGDFTGQAFGATIAHGGPDGLSADSTIREVYGNVNQVGSSVDKGTIITKRTYKKNPDGTKGTLFVTFAMFKREMGYDSDNANWEYVKMPASESIDYLTNPNGVLTADGAARGKLDGCISCHAQAAGNDFVFIND